MIVYTYNKEIVHLEEEPFASGGEGEIRHVTKCPSRFKNVCAKLYFKPRQTSQQEQKIRFMVENPPSNMVTSGMMIIWPLDTIYDKTGGFLGFLMPVAFPDSKKLSILVLPKLKRTLKLEWYKFDKEYNIKYALMSRLKLINNIAIPIHLLHDTNKYVLKDFKPDNVLVTSAGKVSIVDMDSIQICENGKLLFPGTAATDTYIPPEFYKGVGQSKNDILTKSWDNFAVSVVFYQLLFGLHPYVVTPYVDTEESNTIPYCIRENLFPFGSNASKIKSFVKFHDNFKIIPPEVQQLFIKAFGTDYNSRPQAMEWVKVVKQVIGGIKVDTLPPPSGNDIEYVINIADSSNGSISLSMRSAKPGTVVLVYEHPNSGYRLSEISYETSLGKTKILNKEFVMPATHVTVKADFVPMKNPSSKSGCFGVVLGVATIVSFVVSLLI